MITIVPIPVGTPSASSVSLLVQLKQNLCKAYNTSSSIQPQSNVAFTAGQATIQPVTVGGTTTYDAMLPITATYTITYVPKGCCSAVTRLFAETFTVAFSGLTTSPTAFNITVGQQTKELSAIKRCGKTYGYTINTAINITAA